MYNDANSLGGGGKVGNKVAIRMSVSWREGRGEGGRKARRGKRRRAAVLTLEEKAGEAGQQEPQ